MFCDSCRTKYELFFKSRHAVFRYRTNPVVCEYISPAAAVITGFAVSEYREDPELLCRIVHPKDRHLLDPGALLEHSGDPSLVRFIRKDGSVIWMEVSSAATRDVSGSVVTIEGIAADVSERVKLERRVNQAQHLEAIGRLAGGVAHDFNNILTLILGHSNLALSQIASEDPLRRDVEAINDAAERGALLTRQLLALGGRPILPSVLDLNAVVLQIKRLLERIVGENITIITNLSADSVRIKAGLGEVERVILNLVVNARDAMPRGGKLTISTLGVEPNVILSVTDTGTGIDPRTLAQIFEPFFSTKADGTGLGLSTVHEIVKHNDGDISVESRVGTGTTFRIQFPRTNDPASPVTIPKAGAEQRVSHQTVLIVEDDDRLRAVIAKVLKNAGYRVYEAKDATEALQIFDTSTSPIDLLLTDLILPDSDGAALADKISAESERTAVLYMSGYPDQELRRVDHLRFERAFIRKPFDPQDLIERVRQMLDFAQ
jgi:two-component system cell cycle sensor histidine kinase/response regulator CckA